MKGVTMPDNYPGMGHEYPGITQVCVKMDPLYLEIYPYLSETKPEPLMTFKAAWSQIIYAGQNIEDVLSRLKKLEDKTANL
jgi:hypothetical protein